MPAHPFRSSLLDNPPTDRQLCRRHLHHHEVLLLSIWPLLQCLFRGWTV